MENLDLETRNSCDIDLYAMRMLCAFYLTRRHNEIGSMEAFTRKLPKNRLFLVNVGLHRICKYLSELKITPTTLKIAAKLLPEIDFENKALREYLLNINFSKEIQIEGMQEGEIFFENEPVLRFTGPIGIIQYPEKQILSILNHDVRIASKAARMVIAAGSKSVVEMGGRRGCLGPEAARAAYIAGFASTSNVLANAIYDVPCYGTMGHVWVQSYVENEEKAYKDWGDLFKKSTYLPDTYGLIPGVRKVMANAYGNIGSIRLDVDELYQNSVDVRRMLNNSNADYFKTTIGATNDLNEYKIKDLEDRGSAIDWYGAGTEVVCTPDAPTCNFVWKLVAVGDEPVCKISEGGKATYPGKKNVVRHKDYHGKFTHDKVILNTENVIHGILLESQNIDEITKNHNTEQARKRFIKNLKQLPDHLKLISENGSPYKYDVLISEKLINEFKQIKFRNIKEIY